MHQTFVAVWGRGVYHLTGNTPLAINNNLDELYIYSLALTNTTLYAASNSRGVYRTDLDDVNWQTINDGMDDLRIRSLHLAGSQLYAGGKGCRVYTWNDGGSSWEAQTVLTANCEDASVRSIALVQQTLYVGFGLDKGLYYQDGATWRQVTSIPTRPMYGLAYDDVYDNLYVSVYGAGIYRCRVDAEGQPTACSTHNLELPSSGTREIHIHNRLLVVGSDDGVWYQPLSP
jgi:photosystem II stability/assembly factor-like uncharacterized protein